MQCMKGKEAGMNHKISVGTAVRTTFPPMVRVSPGMFCTVYLFFLLCGALEAGAAPAMQYLFEQVTAIVTQGKVGKAVWIGILILLLVKISGQICSSLANFFGEAFDLKAYGSFSKAVQEKINALSAEDMEKPQILSVIEKAYQGIWTAIDFSNTCMDIATYYIPYLAVMGVYLWNQHPALLLVMLIIFFTILLGQRLKAGVMRGVEDKVSPLRRELEHFRDCVSDPAYAKETKTLGAFSFFRNKFKNVMADYHRLLRESYKKAMLVQLGVQFAVLAEYAGILALLTVLLLRGEISAAAFAVIFSSVDGMFQMIDSLVTGRMGSVAENYGKLERFVAFFDLKTSNLSKAQEAADGSEIQEICVENVSYCYPSQEQACLNGLSFTLKAGETMAIVGANGSGKSTLVKLLTGLYRPTEGRILFGGKDCAAQDGQFIRQTAVFQDFVKYRMTLRENIQIGDFYSSKTGSEQEAKMLTDAGLNENQKCFPEGMETMLSPEFGGVDLSGGQWQRIAIARAFYREHFHIFLDEPTAAIDPMEEIRLYEMFREHTQNKTAVIVTHRLGAVKYADKILVLENGKQLFFGSHEEALRGCERYRQMWAGICGAEQEQSQA